MQSAFPVRILRTELEPVNQLDKRQEIYLIRGLLQTAILLCPRDRTAYGHAFRYDQNEPPFRKHKFPSKMASETVINTGMLARTA